MKKKIFLGIAFGTSIRDVLRNDIFRIIKNQNNIEIILFLQDTSKIIIDEFGGENIFFEKLDIYKPSLTERILLHFHKALLREKCKTIDLGNTSGDTRILDKISPIIRISRFFLSYNKINNIIFFFYRFLTNPGKYGKVFEKYQPDLVIVTRVLNYSADYPLMREANKRNVPVIGLVSSWDNLTSKAFFPFSLKALVVWNHVMKEEAISLFNYPSNQIFVSGIPRYDLYFNISKHISRDQLCNKYKLDSGKRIILYCTSSSTSGPSSIDSMSPQPKVAEWIANSINFGSLRYSNSQLLIRLHPQANPEHYNHLIEKKNVVVHIPGRKSEFQDRLFSLDDDLDFASTMYHADVMINMASTVTIDAAVFDTPIVCECIDLFGKRDIKNSIYRFYAFDHFAKLSENDGFELVRTLESLDDKIKFYLDNRSHKKAGRSRIVDQQCVYRDGKSGYRTATYILGVLDLVTKANEQK